MKDFVRRILGSFISIALVVLLLLFSNISWVSFLIAALIATLSCIAVWEYLQLAKRKGAKFHEPWILLFSVLLVLSFFWNGVLPIAVFTLSFFALFFAHFKTTENAIIDLALSFFPLLYIAIPMGLLLSILFSHGVFWVAFLLIVTKMNDIGAYIFGSLLGKTPLFPRISPKKTVEGAIFGTCFAVGSSLLLYWFTQSHVTLGEAIFLSFTLSFVGQFGDFAESLLKRDANKKDSNSLPGLGGVLDLLDSLLLNIVILYLFL